MAVRAEPTIIVGWRVSRDDTASPVFAFKPSGAGTMFLPAGNGQLAGPDGQLHRSIDDAKMAVLNQAQQSWDAAHPVAAKPEPELAGSPPKLAAGGRRGTR
jgi:hypothetical protein